MGKSRRPRIGLLMAAAVAALGPFGSSLAADEIEIRDHVDQLNRKGSYIFDIAGEPAGSSERRAIRRYLETPKGAARFLRLMVSELAASSLQHRRSPRGFKLEKSVVGLARTSPDVPFLTAKRRNPALGRNARAGQDDEVPVAVAQVHESLTDYVGQVAGHFGQS